MEQMKHKPLQPRLIYGVSSRLSPDEFDKFSRLALDRRVSAAQLIRQLVQKEITNV